MFMPMLFVHVTVCCDDVVVFFCKRQVPARVAPHTLRARLFYGFMTFVCKDALHVPKPKQTRSSRRRPPSAVSG